MRSTKNFSQKSRRFRSGLRFWQQSVGGNIRNWLRKKRHGNVGYIVVPVSGSLPELAEPPRTFIERRLPFPTPPLSLQALRYIFRKIEEADNADGIVILLKDFSAEFGTIQSLRRIIERFKQSGKRVIVYTPFLTLRSYYLAAAADLIVVPPSAEFSVMGLQLDALYYKDALAEVGIEVEVVQISPYKTAGNSFGESTMTAAEHEQYSWLLDDQYEMLTRDIAQNLGIAQETFKSLIDQAPFDVQKAQDNGLVDAVAYDDELHWAIRERWSVHDVKLITWGKARKKLTRKIRRRHPQYIGIVGIEGGIMMQSMPSLNPLARRSNSADHATISHLLRRAEREEDMAALIVYVNSPGGDALASDLIWRDLVRIGRKIPLLIYMGNVAASGGYYIAAAGQHIMAQPATLTGSIGVITGRPSTTGLLDKLHINRVSIKRGENAGLYRDLQPLTERERALIFERIEHSYTQFKQVVAKTRPLAIDELDEVALGRVWTGNQAMERQLIDSFGDLQDLIRYAHKVANLPMEDGITVPVHNLYSSSTKYIVPPLLEEEVPTSMADWVDRLTDVFLKTVMSQFNGKPLYMLPFDLQFRD
jgi:protease-4